MTGTQGARGRRWGIALFGIAVGVAILVVGLVIEWAPAMAAGVILFLAFGYMAGGAKRQDIGAEVPNVGSLHARADFTASPVEAQEDETKRPAEGERDL